MKKTLFCIFLFITTHLPGMKAQVIRIGLFNDLLVESLVFHCTKGVYNIYSGSELVGKLEEGELVYLRIDTDGIIVDDGGDFSGRLTSLEFSDPSMNAEFSLKLISPQLSSGNYEGELEVNMKHGVFQLINKIEFDQYLAGVVEAEGGPGAPEEFFKVQAVLCRTYAVKNWEKHLSEGFNLCDDVHCQAFHGKNDENPAILEAVYSTHDIVVADNSYKLITAAYHSNSGGETQKSEGFWPGDNDYLLSIIDPFSQEGRNYRWTDRIEWKTWKSYFAARGIDMKKVDTTALIIRQEHRRDYLVLGKDTIPMGQIREDFGFKSAFFNMKPEGNMLLVEGRGYGHGVGLSQEGAMEMARKGYSYKDILNYYFHNVKVYDLEDLPFNSVPEMFR